MLFHEDKQEQLYDYILNHIFTEYNGKTIGGEGCTIPDIKKSLPGFLDDSSEEEYENATDVREEPVDNMENFSESSGDNEEEKEQDKKEEEQDKKEEPEIVSDPSDEPEPEIPEEPKEPEKKDESNDKPEENKEESKDKPVVKKDESVVDTKPFTDNIDEEPEKKSKENKEKKDKVKKPKKEKVKKPKKEKVEKDGSDKPKTPKTNWQYFKSHPDNQDIIIEAAKQLQGEDGKNPGKPIGKVAGAGVVWKTVSEEEKEVWKQRAIEAFEQLNQ